MNLMESLLANKLAAKQSSGGSDLTPEVKEALLDCFANVAWAVEDGQQYYDALQDALYGLQSISAVYTQSGTVYDTDSLDSLKADLVVTALYGDGSTQTVPAESYTLSGTLTEGTSTITVSYGGKTATFDVVVSEAPLLPTEYQEVEWISANNDTTAVEAYFNTDFLPTPNSSMYVRLASVGTQSGANFAGVRDASSGANNAFLVVSFRSAGKIGFMRWGSSVQAIPYDNDFHDYELTPTTAKIDGVVYSMDAPITSQASTKSIRVFAEYNGNSFINQSNIKMASLILWEGDVKMRQYIPCYRKSDNVIGMYETVNGVFKTNAGNGSFTKGADVE